MRRRGRRSSPAWSKAWRKAVVPAYNTLAAYLETLRAKATRNDGVWALPQGDQFYQHAIESNTTTRMTADEIHALGLAEVARIGAEMDRSLSEAATSRVRGARGCADSARRRRNATRKPTKACADPQGLPGDHRRDQRGTRSLVRHQAEIGVIVVRVPPFAEKTAPGAYYNPPPMDGSQPGKFFANLGNIGETHKYSMRTDAYHEAVPGHHLQNAIAQEIQGLPFFRRVVPFTAYMEGWALYAEQLAWEMGFEKNPLDNLGRLQLEMFRAVRLVVDTGHPRQALDARAGDRLHGREHRHAGERGRRRDRAVHRRPGQALAYKVGMLKILELRERAKGALGGRFDIREFHDQVLKNGAMPLSVLERVIDAYIARKKAARRA
jgi:uncharacterized protein (DUF885 family)